MFQSLMDYQIHYKSLVEVQDINKDWIEDFLHYLTQRHPHRTLDPNLRCRPSGDLTM